jgi:thiamine biosynthesis lipoprotein
LRLLISCLILSIGAAVASCGRAPRELTLSGPAMGTTYSVKVANVPANVEPVAVRQAIDEVLARIDEQMSGYRADSQVARFNAASTVEWFEVGAELAEVAMIAQDVSARSDGAFDVTVAPLVSAWGFGPEGRAPEPPDDAALERLRAPIGHSKLHARLGPPALRKDAPELAVDLNGVAPGYAVDRIADRLRAMQLQDFMIELGGEVRARGRNARGQPWGIAVERPYLAEQKPYAILRLDDAAVATSGEYRHFYVRNGRRYSHTIDPRTGRPVAHALAAVVVIASQAAYADAWATAYNVLGEVDGYALATKLHMPVMFIVADGDALSHRMTPEFERYVAAKPGEQEEPQKTAKKDLRNED